MCNMPKGKLRKNNYRSRKSFYYVRFRCDGGGKGLRSERRAPAAKEQVSEAKIAVAKIIDGVAVWAVLGRS
ncbi:hypothetical protein U1Q18_047011, partial [Sarracenia purpurea var. burkii]